MQTLKNSYFTTEPTFQAPTRATESTFQASTRKYFVNKEKEMAWEVRLTDEFEQELAKLDTETQDKIIERVRMLEEKGPNLRFPYSSGVQGSLFGHMRELRVQHSGEPYRILYAFDPRRVAVLLLVGNKAGNDRWYEENIPKADKLYDEWLKGLEE